MKALMGRYPNAVLQFEDFNMEHATPLLDRYRDHHLCFNDDIQACYCLSFLSSKSRSSRKGQSRFFTSRMLTCLCCSI